MISFDEMYNMSQGIFLAFKNNAKKRQLSVSHSPEKRQRFKFSFPSRFESYTKENFILMCLYINFTKSPSSFERFLEILKESDVKDLLKFKDSIVQYKYHLEVDLNHIMTTYGQPTKEIMFKEYINKNIHFYTLHFYLLYSDQYKDFTNIQQMHIDKIKILLLYLTFSEASLLKIKNLFNESILLN